jgi:XTP/dITP diphosphohydrolase
MRIEENGVTFLENALIKARTAREALAGCEHGDVSIIIADDSGLCVDCLAGAPGIHSARYAGDEANNEENIEKLLKDIDRVSRVNHENRVSHTEYERPTEQQNERPKARFVCAMAAILSDGAELTAEGVCEGEITFARAGENGFGYDPVFFLPDFNLTMAQIGNARKNEISHRGEAIRRLKTKIIEKHIAI